MKITIQKCIINKIRLGESVYPIQIKGDFIDPEKNYLIDASKIQMMWKGVHAYLIKKRKLSRTLKGNHGNFRSEFIYPSKEESVVKPFQFLCLTNEIETIKGKKDTFI